MGIAENEAIAVADQTANGKSAVEERDGLSEEADQVELAG